MAEKWKRCDIYRKCVMCTEKHVLVKKLFTNEMVLPIQVRVKKTVHGVKIPGLSDKEKILGY